MRKLLSFLCICLCSIAVHAEVETGTCGDNLTWSYDSETQSLTITGSGAMYDYFNNVPWQHVVGSILSVSLPEGLTSIGQYAFSSCYNLTSITIPESVTSIEYTAFGDCSGLASVTIGDGVTNIGSCAFTGCSGLTSIMIPESVTSIGSSAFSGCSGLTSIMIPESVTSIGSSAFSGCSSLTTVVVNEVNQTYDSRGNCNGIIETSSNTLVVGCKNTIIPESVTSIGNSAFSNCSGLTSIIIPESVTSIGDNAFIGCSGLTSIIIPESVTSIGFQAFRDCSSLTSITIPNGVIGTSAFLYCSGLISISIGSGVTSIKGSPFSGCSSLTTIVVNEANQTYDSRDNCNGIIETSSNKLVLGCKSTVIPAGVTSIISSAFEGCSGLTSITIPDGVTSIGNYAFRGCFGLVSITIPDGVTNIGTSAFEGCSSLISIAIPDGVMYIDRYVFSGCSALTSITIGRGVTRIEHAAFSGTSLDTIVVRATTPPSCPYAAFDAYDAMVYIPCGSLSAYQADAPWSFFTDYQELVSPYALSVQPDDRERGSVQIVEEPTCSLMEAVIAATPNAGYRFLWWDDGNTDNPRTVLVTQDTAFTAMFEPLFGKCGDDLYWEYSNAAIEITGTGAMYNYTDSTQPWLLLRDSVTAIRIGHTATSIGENAFAQMSKLSKVYIGASIETIEANAFAECQRLFDIYCYPTYPPFADETSFANYNAYLYVPCEVEREYSLDVVWGKFGHIECLDPDDPYMSFDEVRATPDTEDVRKVVSDGQVVIVRDGKTYTLLGQEVR